MTSLQETAMGGGPATAKTASYVLVAADAGTTVAMNAAGSTTITVNTGLFAAGDTVFIQNLGAGACTVTAGTATVATAGSLILPQNDAGILYFTSASAAIFYDYIQVGATSPLTTKGDIYVYGSSDTRLPVGSNDQILVADSSTATGLKWAAAASGGMTLISTTTLSGASVTLSSIPTTHKHLQLVILNCLQVDDGTRLGVRFNGDSNANRYYMWETFGSETNASYNADIVYISHYFDNGSPSTFNSVTTFWNYGDASVQKMASNCSLGKNWQTDTNFVAKNNMFLYNQTTAITSLVLTMNTGNFTSGTALLYGVS